MNEQLDEENARALGVEGGSGVLPRVVPGLGDFHTHFRWVVIVLLFAITIVNYLDRSALSFALTDISAEFHLGPTLLGYILGAFGIGYLVSTGIGGFVTDQRGPRVVFTFVTIFWSLSMVMTGLAGGFVVLLAARLVLGLSEGPSFPALNRSLSDWLPLRERARAIAGALVAVPIALAIGSIITTQLIGAVGWRVSFFVLAGLCLAWLPFWLYFFRNRPEASRFVSSTELDMIGTEAGRSAEARTAPDGERWGWVRVLRDSTYLANTWAFFVFGFYLFFFMSWIPYFLQHSYGMKLSEVGWFDVAPWGAAAVFIWLGGYLSDLLLIRTGSLRVARAYVIAGSQLLSAVFIVPLAFVHNLVAVIVILSLAVATAMGANAVFYAVNVDLSRRWNATALGLMIAFNSIAAFLAPALTGWLVSAFYSFDAVFILMALLALSSVILVLVFHRGGAAQAV